MTELSWQIHFLIPTGMEQVVRVVRVHVQENNTRQLAAVEVEGLLGVPDEWGG